MSTLETRLGLVAVRHQQVRLDGPLGRTAGLGGNVALTGTSSSARSIARASGSSNTSVSTPLQRMHACTHARSAAAAAHGVRARFIYGRGAAAACYACILKFRITIEPRLNLWGTYRRRPQQIYVTRARYTLKLQCGCTMAT